MLDGEWRLEYPGATMTWGLSYPGATYSLYNFSYPNLGDRPIAGTDDTARPRADGLQFGQDYLGGPTFGFEIAVIGATEQIAREAAELVSTAWRADPVRTVAGAVATLTARYSGRERCVYGRPRRHAPGTDIKVKSGILVVQLDFQVQDDLWYDPTFGSSVVNFVPPPSGGFTVPFVSPLTTSPVTTIPGAIVVGGAVEANTVVTVNGPITNPVVEVVGQWQLALNATIAAGQSVRFDSRDQSVTRVSDGASYAGSLSRLSRLDQAQLTPGSYTISLSGVDVTGTSSMLFQWQNTYTSL